ncbi:hypothetical protein [Bradyrhizobium sp. 45]|uniref:hypothetical protein n=1 Tax=Bradyrhizobium sp. 45 TaxID=1043587 RepID=UPI001FF796D9|nr:hypothetical protein [Bradyrhizobium sp. 45]MCK1307639.1 hypothetical protein [Bradyrhizobium sp. 45]
MNRLASRIGEVLLLLGAIILSAPPARSQNTQPSPVASDTAAGTRTGSGAKLPTLERYPDRLEARIELRRRTLSTLGATASGLSPHFILNLTKRWQPAQTLKIAFRGGDTSLHQDIATVVTEWTQYANLKFDFGLDPATGKYRSWNTSDSNFAADIRVSFDQRGYYSLVGNDSINRTVTKPGEESLNLQGFDQERPDDWKAVALHEFGHAIGFEHEHQSPLAPCDFRFDDDAGYVPTTDSFGQYIPDGRNRRPGLYTLLGGPPNNWPATVVDFNLKSLADSHAYEVGLFNKTSIMKYFFKDWMFVTGTNSPCYTSAENLVLSDGDKEGAAKVYPRTPESIRTVSSLRAQALEAAVNIKNLSPAALQHFREELNQVQK